MQNRRIKVGDFYISNDERFTLIAGPCQLENQEHALMLAKSIKNICDKLGINYIFKASFDKANRTSVKSKRGVGIDAAVDIFKVIKKEIKCPIITDFHTSEQFNHPIIDSIDVIQIPAFLCRQTDLLKSAAETNKPVNIKKGQKIYLECPLEGAELASLIVEEADKIGGGRVIVRFKSDMTENALLRAGYAENDEAEDEMMNNLAREGAAFLRIETVELGNDESISPELVGRKATFHICFGTAWPRRPSIKWQTTYFYGEKRKKYVVLAASRPFCRCARTRRCKIFQNQAILQRKRCKY